MDYLKAIEDRHSVRKYKDLPIEDIKIEQIKNEIVKNNNISGLNIQLMTNEPQAFSGFYINYGKFENVKNYIAIVGNKKDTNLNEKAGYYGEKIVLLAQSLGLNTCWIAVTFNKKMAKKHIEINKDQELVCVISIGYGVNNGYPRKSKEISEVTSFSESLPKWYIKGIESALKAPTAINQQKFYFKLYENNLVEVKDTKGYYSSIDLGIVKLHFELGAGDNFVWKD